MLLTSPFFLENLSYKYDSLPMSLSVLMAIVPFTLYRNHIFIPMSILCLVAVLGLYQTTSMLYFAVTICIIMSSVLDGKNKTECFKLACKTLVSFVVAFLIYKSLVLLLALNVPRSQFISINSEILNLLIERTKHFHIMLKALFDSGYFIASAPFVILFAMSLVYLLALRKS
ncbi:glucosyltransferase domain-containing protein, partial [Escherichia coli]|uniref:glucosyltransferase domain-containing protein n=2 Tax=Escherichia coli TaxID=562 RepID=UPI00207CADA6